MLRRDEAKFSNLTFDEKKQLAKQKREIKEIEDQKKRMFCLVKSDALNAYKNMKVSEAMEIKVQR